MKCGQIQHIINSRRVIGHFKYEENKAEGVNSWSRVGLGIDIPHWLLIGNKRGGWL